MTISASDELRHRPSDDPAWREAIWFCWQMPEHGMGAAIAYSYRPNVEQPGSHLRIWLCEGLEREVNRPRYFWHRQFGVPEDDFDDFRLEPGLRMERLDPLHGFRFHFDDGDRLTLDLEMRFFAGAYHWADGIFPPPVYLGNRYHCPFAVTGTLRLDGQVITVDHYGDHDHSWGTRPLDWHALEKIKYVAGQFGPEFAFSVATTIGPDGGVLPHGFVWDGETKTPVADVELANEYGPDGVQRKLWMNLVDKSGRLTHVAGDVFANFPAQAVNVPGNPVIGTDYHNNDAFARMRVDGRGLEGSGIVSYYWGRDYYLRTLMGGSLP